MKRDMRIQNIFDEKLEIKMQLDSFDPQAELKLGICLINGKKFDVTYASDMEHLYILCDFLTSSLPRRDLLESNMQRKLLSEPIDTLEFSDRISNILKAQSINTVEQLANLSEIDILRIPNLGRASLIKIKNVLSLYGLSLK